MPRGNNQFFVLDYAENDDTAMDWIGTSGSGVKEDWQRHHILTVNCDEDTKTL